MRMEAVIQLCDAHTVDNFKIGTAHTNGTLFDIIKDIAPTYNDTMFYCKWRNEDNFCDAFFRPILTEEGVCYTFNALNSRDIYKKEYVIDSCALISYKVIESKLFKIAEWHRK